MPSWRAHWIGARSDRQPAGPFAYMRGQLPEITCQGFAVLQDRHQGVREPSQQGGLA